jgi:hypothetical protein
MPDCAITRQMPNLCEVGENERDDNSHQRALASTDDLARVNRHLAVSGARNDDGTVDESGGILVSGRKS